MLLIPKIKNKFAIYLALIIAGLNTNLVSALDENEAKEMACIKVQIDPNWKIFNATEWYWPMWSKLGQYRMAAINLGKNVSDVSEADLVNDCEKFSTKDFILNGFHNGGKTHVTWDEEDDGGFRYHADGNDRKFYVVLADSEYSLYVECWDDNQASWMVTSATPTISDKNRETIIERVKSLGFDLDKLVDESYDHCDDPVPSVESFESSEEKA